MLIFSSLFGHLKMFIRVRLLKGFPKPLFYKAPQENNYTPTPGEIVTVPIKNIVVPALILDSYSKLPFKPSFVIKEFKSVERLPADNLYHSFVKKISSLFCTSPVIFLQKN